MAAAAGKNSTTSLSLSAYGLAVEEELSTLVTQYCAEEVWTGKWYHEQREAWTKQNASSGSQSYLANPEETRFARSCDAVTVCFC